MIKDIGTFIKYYPLLGKYLGSIQAAVYYQQLCYWSYKGYRTDGFFYKTKEDLESETNLTIKQQDLVRKRLVQNGWLETRVFRSPTGAPTLHYRCLINIEDRGFIFHVNGRKVESIEGGKVMLESDQMVLSIESTERDFSSMYKNTHKNTYISKPDNADSEESKKKILEIEASFAIFWKEYPKKVSKTAAERSWRKLNPSPNAFKSIMEGLRRSKGTPSWIEQNGRFIPHPGTFLNNRRWEDEIVSTRISNPKSVNF